MGSQGLPHYIYIYVIYIYIFMYVCIHVYIYIYDICIWYIWQCHLLIPQIIPKTSLPGTWKKAEPSEVHHQARREGLLGESPDFMGISWELLCDFNGNTMISMGILVCRKGPQKVSLSWLVTWWTFRFVGNITILRWDCRPTKNLGASSCGNILIWWE